MSSIAVWTPLWPLVPPLRGDFHQKGGIYWKVRNLLDPGHFFTVQLVHCVKLGKRIFVSSIRGLQFTFRSGGGSDRLTREMALASGSSNYAKRKNAMNLSRALTILGYETWSSIDNGNNIFDAS